MDALEAARDPRQAICLRPLGSKGACLLPPHTGQPTDRMEIKPHGPKRLISLLLPAHRNSKVPADPVALTTVSDDATAKEGPLPRLAIGPQPSDPRLRPNSIVDDRWGHMPGAMPSASATLYSDSQVELKAGMDGGLVQQSFIPQLTSIGAGVVCHVHRNVDVHVSMRVPADQSQSKEGQAGYMGVGVHW